MQEPRNADYLDLQLAASLRGDFDEAWRLSQILEQVRPNDDRAAFNRGWHYMRRGDLIKGFELTERGRVAGVFGAPPIKTKKPRWSGTESLQGKTLLLYGEGGFGDEILNARFAAPLAALGARVIFACNGGMLTLLRRVHGVAETIPHGTEESAEFDYWLPAMSAPLALKTTYQTLSGEPYLTADKSIAAAWSALVKGPGLKVGIRWSGNPRFEHEQHRRFSPGPLFELSELPGVTVYSFQRDHDLRDLPEKVIDLQHLINTWEDTAAAIENLDIMITSCTATAHLAAAMGKETWIIVPVLPYYIWALPGDTSPWYKTVRLFRQEEFDSWDTPLKNVRAALQKKLSMQIPHTNTSEPQVSDSAAPSMFQKFGTQEKIFPGLVVAPHPTPKTVWRSAAPKKTIYFVAGLPRCGSTALLSLMAQNPRIYTAPISGLSGIFSGIFANWDKGESHIELPNPEAKRRVLLATLENYHDTDRPVILDKDRQWVLHLPLLEDLLERPVKVIIPVRPIPEILASFEMLRRKTPAAFTLADESLGPGSTIAGRAQYFAGPGGALGLAYNALKDAVTSGYLDRMLFVDYNKLTSAPKTQLKRVYEFLEEPYFEHDLNNVEQIAHGDSWRAQKLVGLHDVRKEFKKEPKSARDILGGDVFGQYNQTEPWLGWI